MIIWSKRNIVNIIILFLIIAKQISAFLWTNWKWGYNFSKRSYALQPLSSVPDTRAFCSESAVDYENDIFTAFRKIFMNKYFSSDTFSTILKKISLQHFKFFISFQNFMNNTHLANFENFFDAVIFITGVGSRDGLVNIEIGANFVIGIFMFYCGLFLQLYLVLPVKY